MYGIIMLYTLNILLFCQLYLSKAKNKYLFIEEMLSPRLKGTLSSPESQMRKLRPREAGPRSHSYWGRSRAIHTSLKKQSDLLSITPLR